MCSKNLPRASTEVLAIGDLMFENAAMSGLGAGIVITLDENILLVQVNYGSAKGKWILPGGTVDKGEHPEETAIRELNEETGLDGQVTGLLGVRHRIHDQFGTDANVYYVFAGELSEESKIDTKSKLKWDPEELIDVKFWPLTQAVNSDDLAPTTKMLIKKYCENNNLATKMDNPNKGNFSDSLFIF